MFASPFRKGENQGCHPYPSALAELSQFLEIEAQKKEIGIRQAPIFQATWSEESRF